MELEYKFLATEATNPEAVTAIAGALGWACTTGASCVICDEYWDRADGTLEKGGETIRLRRCNGKLLYTHKSGHRRSDGLFCRAETEHETEEGSMRSALRVEGMEPVLTVENTRILRGLTLGDARVELSLDGIVYESANGGTGTERQLELELKSDGGAQVLGALAEAVAAGLGLVPMTESKFQRGMAITRCSSN